METLVNIIINYFMTESTHLENSQQWTEDKADVSAWASFFKEVPLKFWFYIHQVRPKITCWEKQTVIDVFMREI